MDVRSDDTGVNAASPAGKDQGKEIVLPEVDRQQVILDLAHGGLVPLPPVGPEPQKLEQAWQKLGKGDFLYDCDSGIARSFWCVAPPPSRGRRATRANHPGRVISSDRTCPKS